MHAFFIQMSFQQLLSRYTYVKKLPKQCLYEKFVCKTLMKSTAGGDSRNLLSKFVRFFITMGLNILALFRLQVKYFLKQISFKGDVNYCMKHKVPFFCESTLKVQKILRIFVRSFVNSHPDA